MPSRVVDGFGEMRMAELEQRFGNGLFTHARFDVHDDFHG
jgi:hypothetical protein